MPPKVKSATKQSYHQKRKARGDRQISLWLSADEFQKFEQLRQIRGVSLKELLLQSIAPEHVSPGPEPLTQQIDDPQQNQLSEESERGELFAFAGQKDFLLVTIVLDRNHLPEWHPLEVSCIKGFDHADTAIQYFCQNPKKFPKFAQTVLMHRADEAHLGFVPDHNHWYYVVHILFEVYPRQMNAYGDFETYDTLLAKLMLE